MSSTMVLLHARASTRRLRQRVDVGYAGVRRRRSDTAADGSAGRTQFVHDGRTEAAPETTDWLRTARSPAFDAA